MGEPPRLLSRVPPSRFIVPSRCNPVRFYTLGVRTVPMNGWERKTISIDQVSDDLQCVSLIRGRGTTHLQATDCLPVIRNSNEEKAPLWTTDRCLFGRMHHTFPYQSPGSGVRDYGSLI